MPHHSASTGRILIVTTTDAASSVSALLREAGHVLIGAKDRDEAQDAAATRAPDLVLLEADTLDEESFELIAALAGRGDEPQLPLLVLSDGSDPRQHLRAFGAGAIDFIPTPCDQDELLARVRVQLHHRHARERLEHELRKRQELFNLIAHDIKNPLTSVLFALEMLSLPNAKPERAARYLEIIEESTHEALDYVRDYLEDQSPDSRGHAPVSRTADLGDTLRWLAARYELQLEAHGLRLLLDVPDADICLTIDSQQLRHVGENLLGNALKYARAGGAVELLGRPGSNGRWQMVVQDRGPGVPADFQPSLFKPFQRVDGHDAPDGMSYGLGLALARQIVVGAGGRFWYEDREGGGARFIVELPASRCAEPPDAAQTP